MSALLANSTICILIPYFGRWPEWTELFFESCRWNPSIDWIILSDQPELAPSAPGNVVIRRLSLAQCLRHAEATLGINVSWMDSYKLCDLRPAFGHLFEPIIQNYAYFGYGDLDVIYGNIRKFLSKDVLEHDCISFGQKHLNGHLCLLRNTPVGRYWYRELPDWKQRMEDPDYTHLDELKKRALPRSLRIYCKESFNTPLSPHIPWTNGRFEFPREWYWSYGILTNDMDRDREFPYLHFMHWKGGRWPRACGNAQWEKLDRLVHLRPGECRSGFRINERGFLPLADPCARG